MKLLKHRKYQTPRMGSTFLDVEGSVCQTLSATETVDELNNVNTNGYVEDGVTKYEESYFDI